TIADSRSDPPAFSAEVAPYLMSNWREVNSDLSHNLVQSALPRSRLCRFLVRFFFSHQSPHTWCTPCFMMRFISRCAMGNTPVSRHRRGQCLPAANIFDPSISECERDYALGL